MDEMALEGYPWGETAHLCNNISVDLAVALTARILYLQ